jgi:hypothetical protein
MHAFTSRDLTAGAFPQVGVDPLDVQRVDREPALVPPVACKCGCDKACGCQCRGPRDCRRDVDDLRAQVTRLEDVPASRGKAVG